MKNLKKAVIILLVLLFAVIITGCDSSNESQSSPLFIDSEAKLTTEKNITLKVKDLDKEYVSYIVTTADNLFDALNNEKLIAYEEGEYGIFVTAFGGVVADGSDGTYWTFRDKDGEFFPTSVDTTKINDGDVIHIVRE